MNKLVTCARCGSNACNELEEADAKVWLCFGCGFVSNSVMKAQLVEEYAKALPEIYKALRFKDTNDNYWFPTAVNIPTKGMVFADGKSKDQWTWAGVLAVPILTEEVKQFPSGSTHKMDMKTIKYFEQQDFMEALDYIKYFEEAK